MVVDTMYLYKPNFLTPYGKAGMCKCGISLGALLWYEAEKSLLDGMP